MHLPHESSGAAERADVTPDEHIEAARLVLTVEVASELEVATAEDLVFPRSIRIERPDHSETFFPGWPGSVLLLTHENQGVCSFGLSLDGPQAGAVVVGGEIEGEIGTMVHTPSPLVAFGGWRAAGRPPYWIDVAERGARGAAETGSEAPFTSGNITSLRVVGTNIVAAYDCPRGQ